MHTQEKTQLLIDTIMIQAFADAFGYLIEFDNIKSINQKYGKNGPSVEKSKTYPLYISDDTQMTFFALEGILQCIESQEFQYHQKAIKNAFLNWLATQKHTTSKYPTYLLSQEFLYHKRAPGNTCLQSLSFIDNNRKITFDTQNKANNSKGCGGIMRTLPFAFFAQSEQEAWDYGCNQASVTHGHINGYTSSGFYTLLCYHLLNTTTDLSQAYQLTKSYAQTQPNELSPYLNKLDQCLDDFKKNNIQLTSLELNSKLGEGWVGDEALVISIYCAITSPTLQKSIEVSSIHNGDSDSTALLTAGLYKLSHPLETIPEIKNLIEYESINEVLNFFSSKIYSIYQKETISRPKFN